MTFKNSVTLVFFLIISAISFYTEAQENGTDGIEINAHQPFEKAADFANFSSCTSKEVVQRKTCFNSTFAAHMAEQMTMAPDTSSIYANKKVYFKFLLGSEGLVSKITIYNQDEASPIRIALKAAIYALPKMTVASIDQKQASTEYVMYAHYVLGKAKTYKVIDIKTKVIPTEEDNLKKKAAEGLPFVVIEDVPIYPGCETVSSTARRRCFNQKIQRHIQKNFNYPEEAQKLQIEGKVITSFMVNKKGDITKIVTRGPHPLLELEARRIFSKLPQMVPGKHRGKAVQVPFAIPLSFKLH